MTATAATVAGKRAARSTFYSRTALVMLAMVFSAFPVSYFAPMVTGSRPFTPVYHIHGLLYFAWIVLYAWQTHLVASGRVGRHRELGLAGIAISAMMLPMGIILAVDAMNRRISDGHPLPYAGTLFNVVDLGSFILLMSLSIASVTRHVEWHRRWTYGAAICLVGPAISRWYLGPWFVRLPPLHPWVDLAPNLTADLFLIALVIHDRRTLGRIHPATLWLCFTLVPLHLAGPFIAISPWWQSIAPALTRLS